MLKRLLIPVFVLVALFGATVANAQESLAYGDTVEANMTATEYEFEYTFTGTAGDVIIIDFQPVDQFGDLDDPVIVLTNADGVVASTVNAFSFGEATLFTQLPGDGDYTILATREGGVAGESVGEFTLTLLVAEVLEPGAVVSGSSANDERLNYYTVNTESNFAVSYVKTGGDMPVDVILNTIDEESADLEELGLLRGAAITEGIFGVFPGGLYILSVGEEQFNFAFDAQTADFNIELQIFE